jgi:hypothetical protein
MSILDCTVAITGCARDIESDISRSLLNLKKVASLFKKSCFIFAENDSVDSTLEQLEKFKAITPNTQLIVYKDLDQQEEYRTHRLAFLRNQLINTVHTKYPDTDYIIMADLDRILRYISINQIRKCFDLEWDMIAASSIPYYDIWALRSNKNTTQFLPIDFDCAAMIESENRAYTPKYRLKWLNKYLKTRQHKRSVYKWIKRYKIKLSGEQLIPVNSAFNGLAIYKTNKTIGCLYNGKILSDDKILKEQCEHVQFHQDMRVKHNASLFINPKLLLKVQ